MKTSHANDAATWIDSTTLARSRVSGSCSKREHQHGDVADQVERHRQPGAAAAARSVAGVRGAAQEHAHVKKLHPRHVAEDDYRGHRKSDEPQPRRARPERGRDESEGDERHRKRVERPRRLALVEAHRPEDAVVDVVGVGGGYPRRDRELAQHPAHTTADNRKRGVEDRHPHRQNRHAKADE